MLKPRGGTEQGRNEGLSHDGNGTGPNGRHRSAEQGGAYISHGPFGPNGLYRAHGERGASHGFGAAQPTRGGGVVARGFGGAVETPGAATGARAQAQRSPQMPAAEAGTASKAASGTGLAALPGSIPAASGAADLSRWGGVNPQVEPPAGVEQVRTPELQMLVVDDDAGTRAACVEIASAMGFNVTVVPSVVAARSILAHQMADLVLVDLQVPGVAGTTPSLVEEIKRTMRQTALVVMTSSASVDTAVEALRVGVGDYLTKPLVHDELTSVLERVGQSRYFDIESRLLRARLRTPEGMGKMIGRSPEMEKLYRFLSKVAHSTHPVLILGESGTGKELVARSIHENGPNASKPFVPVDCSSLVSTLMESELFGYVKGAFTGANKTKEGLLVAAEGGTVFLDEIGEIPLDMQAKLLRALQEREVRPVGATQAVPISARVLAATNRDLGLMVEQGRFRKDLYFRLNVVNLRIPPLRDRREDIPVLAMHFLNKMRADKKIDYEFAPDAWRTMLQFDWPGNVRELEHAIERACALSSGPILQVVDLPSQLQEFRLEGQKRDAEAALAAERTPAHNVTQREPNASIRSIAEMERHAILETIEYLDGDKLAAAKLLGIGKTTLYRKLKEYGLGDSAEGGN